MTLTYEASLTDVAEPSVRLFLRGKTYATHRWRGALLCAAIFAALAFLGFNAKEAINLPLVCFAAAAWGAGLFLLVYKSSVRRRVINYITTELKGPWPRPTVIEIKDGRLIRTTSGTPASFPLADLRSVVDDGHYLELVFGPKSLCLIPLRAVDSTDEKHAFRALLGHPSA